MSNIDRVVENIRKATKGFGTDEKLLIDSIVQLSPQDSHSLDQYYKANYGKSVIDVIESETRGNFGKLLTSCVVPEPYVAARTIHRACNGFNVDEKVLRELFVGRSNAEMKAIKDFYHAVYGKNLEEDIKHHQSSNAKKFYTVILQAMRDERSQRHTNVDADVQALYKAGEGKIGTDETEFIHILLTRGDAHLRKVFDVYAHKHGRAMEKVIKKEFSGEIENILLDVVRCANNRGEYFAELFEDSMKGMGTDEDMLHRLTTRIRGTPLMHEVKEAYLKKYGKTLELRIKGETSGDHEKLLTALINQNHNARMYYFYE